MSWGPEDEAKHPRDAEGQFTDSWAVAVADRITGIPTYRRASHIPPEVEDRYRRGLIEELRISHEEPPEPFGSAQTQESYERRMDWYDAQAALRETDATIVDRQRVHQDAQLEYYRDWYRRRNHPDMTIEQMHTAAAGWAREAFASRQVAVRTTPASLARVLEDGRFRTVHDIGVRSGGLNDVNTRAIHEQSLWGYEPGSDTSARPVYGYLAGADRHARKNDGLDEALSQYGRIEVRLRDTVRGRTTAMFGDSLDIKHAGRPAPVDNPDGWAWTYANPGGLVTHRLASAEHRQVDDPDFMATSGYIEAQIHGGVQVGDIERVVFPSPPSAALKAALDRWGIPWKVVKP